MSARKQMFVKNPCHCWWQLHKWGSWIYLQGLFISSPELWGFKSSLMRFTAHLSPQNYEEEKWDLPPTSSSIVESLHNLCKSLHNTHCSVHPVSLYHENRTNDPDPTEVNWKTPITLMIITTVIIFLIWKIF